MEKERQHIIYTIGHSTRSMDEFLTILRSFEITFLADIRTYPGSRKYPQFNSDSLQHSIEQAGIAYRHIPELGGRRRPAPDSHNKAWRNESFRGYADYMETAEFVAGVKKLEAIAIKQCVAFMCSEAVWWRCHRSLVADYLKVNGWKVMHIMGIGKATEHPFTSPAKENGGSLNYR